MTSPKASESQGKIKETLRLWAVCTVILLLALLWFYPVMFFRWLKKTLTQNESPQRTASAVALGVGMSVMPIWSFQMLATVGLAHLFKLNKVVAVAFSNSSLPPFIPFIIYFSLHIGGLLLGVDVNIDLDNVSMESIKDSVEAYAVGAVVFGILLGVATWPVAYFVIRALKRRRTALKG